MDELVKVLNEIRDELRTQNEKLERIENSLDRIYGAFP